MQQLVANASVLRICLEELMETELCSELVREAKALAEQAESLRMRETQRDARSQSRVHGYMQF